MPLKLLETGMAGGIALARLVAGFFGALVGLACLRLRGAYALITLAIMVCLQQLIQTDATCAVPEKFGCSSLTGGPMGLWRFIDFDRCLGDAFRNPSGARQPAGAGGSMSHPRDHRPAVRKDPSSVLLAPFAAGPLRLRNRVVMAPMTREFAPHGVPTAEMARYYRRRAEGGVGLILTEGTAPDLRGAFGSAVPRFFGAGALAGWARVGDAVHDAGGRIMVQLWHVGAFEPSLIGMADSLSGVARVSPSGLAAPGMKVGAPMSQAEIDDTIEAFAAAAEAARRLGFDGVEIHGAHGYLIDQFFWAPTNLRSDRYGGDIEGRARFAAELIAECRSRTGPDFPIVLRISQWKQRDYAARIVETPDELARLLAPLKAAGVSLFHCSARRFWEPAFPGSPLSFAAWTRKVAGLPVIAVGSVTLSNEFKSAMGKVRAEIVPEEIDRVAAAMAAGDFDLIAVGRALIANPDWVRKVEAGRLAELRPFSKEMLTGLD